ncbi:hypothetical protein [Actinokineospora diospyrosa]|uniref:Uncharacterized protein n=1 Tax=Actinokineospora diospyrosa TaxID=103728 RepID=A0ABT1IE40_9PSEU|nr:hypothetical protein [Actinokineospora diospyrosa]MCP2270829.1 hypothetical protein [Actinokineospora diospyrosa]
MKKLVNLYRLLRISAHDELDTFLSGADTAPFQAAAVLLTAVTGRPTQAATLLTAIQNCAHGSDMIVVLRDCGAADIAEWIEKNPPVMTEAVVYRKWAPLVGRFSFETYRLLGHQEVSRQPTSGETC